MNKEELQKAMPTAIITDVPGDTLNIAFNELEFTVTPGFMTILVYGAASFIFDNIKVDYHKGSISVIFRTLSRSSLVLTSYEVSDENN